MPQIKARAVIKNDKNQVFLCSIKIGDSQLFCLPGGTLEEGETVLECLHREIIEELAVTPTAGKLIAENSFVRKDGQSVCDIRYEVTNREDFVDIDLSKASHGFEILEYGFYDKNDVPHTYKPDNLFDMI